MMNASTSAASAASNFLLTAALNYANRGWPVFPCYWPIDGRCACGAHDCTSEGKHPLTQAGFKDASTDELLIRAWWEKWPQANIGLPTGAPTSIAVVDVDESQAWSHLKNLLPGNDFKLAGRQKTGKKDGWHLAFSIAPGLHVKTALSFFLAWIAAATAAISWSHPPSTYLAGITNGNTYQPQTTSSRNYRQPF